MASVIKRTWGDPPRTSWQVDYRDARGARKRRQFKTKRDAKAFAENLSELRGADAIPDVKVKRKVRDLLHGYLLESQQGRDGGLPLESHTIAVYRGYITNYLDPAVGDLLVHEIVPAEVRRIRDELIQSVPSRATAKKVYSFFKTVLRHAAALDYIKGDPTVGIAIKMDSRDRKGIDIHSKQDVRTIVRFVVERAREVHSSEHRRRLVMRDALLIQILFYCGLRLSEARALRFDCFDAEACTVQVKARCDRQGSLGRLKTGRAFRHVPVTAELIQEVVQFEAHNNSPFLFTTRNRTILDDASIRKNIWIPAHRESGVVLRNIHAARHFFASRHIEIGTNLKELSALLGHADEAFTLRVYGHLFDDKENRARRRRQAESLVV